MAGFPIPAVVAVGVLTALALTRLGVQALRVWSLAGADTPARTTGQASRRALRALVLSTLCFMAVAALAVLGVWALVVGDF
jgi:hypothetical protein